MCVAPAAAPLVGRPTVRALRGAHGGGVASVVARPVSVVVLLLAALQAYTLVADGMAGEAVSPATRPSPAATQ